MLLARFRCYVPVLTMLALGAASGPAFAQHDTPDPAPTSPDPQPALLSKESPWLLAPVLTNNPKLGTSFGALAGYVHYFDQKSRPSIFGITGQYSSTGSIVAGAFGRTSFDEDHNRLIAGLAYGNIKNDYNDYLGTGVPLQNNAELRAFVARYTYRVGGDWFLGGQGIYQNFAVAGATAFDDLLLDILGVQPFKSAAVGLVVQNDTRDDENMPRQGWLLNVNNLAFRESFGGDNDYDVYRIDIRYFIPHGDRHVFALRQLNHLTHDAPAAARAPVQLRGYKIGQFNGEFMSSIEGEERFRLGESWTATVFAGLACTYGDSQSCSDRENLFGAAGAGLQYILKPKEGLVLNLEYAAGKDGNQGVYLKIGYAY
jgi:outer membrane protein assembly factor BamA